MLKNKQLYQIEMYDNIFSHIFEEIINDTTYLSKILNNNLENNYDYSIIEQDFFYFLDSFYSYDQIRLLDTYGMEKIKVIKNGDKLKILDEKELKYKKDRYYFSEMLNTKKDFYLSPLDLNIENNEIEIPFIPTLRISTILRDKSGSKLGVFILNYNASELLDFIYNLSLNNNFQGLFVNSDGYYLNGFNSEDEWGFMFPNKKDKTIANLFPDEWSEISNNDYGQLCTDNGLFTYKKININDYSIANTVQVSEYWYIINYLEPGLLNRKLNLSDYIIFIIGLIIVLFISYIIANSIENKKLALLQKEKLYDEKTKKLLEKNNKFYKNIFDLSSLGIAEVSLSGNFLLLNEHFCHITGYSKDELLKMTFADITYKEDLDNDMNNVNILLSGKSNNYTMEKRYIHKDGYIIWVKLIVTLVYNENKDMQYFLSIISDISDLKRNELELKKQSKALLYSPLSIIITDKNGLIEYVNPAFESITGYSKEELIGKNPNILNTSKHSKNFYSNLWNTILNGETWKGTFINKKKNGDLYWEEASISPIFDSDNKIVNFVAVKEDITARITIEKALKKSKIEAEKANKAKTVFLSNMSHEIRTPLNSILGFSNILLKDKHLNNEQKNKISIINKTGTHLLTIINDILQISKIESGKIDLVYSEFNLNDIISELKNMFLIKSTEKNIDLRFETKTEIPEILKTDELKLKQILINLIGNSIKFTEKGNITLSFSLISEDKDMLSISVRDTGIGMSQKNLNKIFDNFIQIYDSKYSKGGTGLGLSITKEFIELLGGEISVRSKINVGSEFIFTIPIEIISKNNINISTSTISTKPKINNLSLNDDIKNKLNNAIEDGDIELINSIIDNLEDKELHYKLKKLSEEFKFVDIYNLIKNKKGDG